MSATPAIQETTEEDAADPRPTPRRKALGARRLPARRGFARVILPWAAILVITLCWDRAVYLHVTVSDPASKAAMEQSGWYMALRSLGTLYPWAGLAVLFLLLDMGAPASPARLRNPLRRATFLILSPLAAGGIAELMKPIVGRYKPEGEIDGWFVFAGLRERFTEWSDLGMASSHTAVAFGGAFALSWILPRGAPLFVALAVGCAMTRLLAGAHFLSDVYMGIVVAYLTTRGIHAIDLRNNAGAPIGG